MESLRLRLSCGASSLGETRPVQSSAGTAFARNVSASGPPTAERGPHGAVASTAQVRATQRTKDARRLAMNGTVYNDLTVGRPRLRARVEGPSPEVLTHRHGCHSHLRCNRQLTPTDHLITES